MNDPKLFRVLVQRNGVNNDYVVATATEQTVAGGEWFWGHYFSNYADALRYYNSVR